jgi:hypothetical protein
MATRRGPSIFGHGTKPDDSGNVYREPHAIFGSNDRYPQMLWVFKDTSTRDKLGGRFYVPKDYVGSPVIVLIWAATVTSGNARWEFDYTAIADAESGDPSADQESVGSTVAVPGTARLLKATSLSLTAGNFAADDQVQFAVARDGAEAGPADTAAGSIYLFDGFFQYSDA